MKDCTCNCQCKPDMISFWWMNDNHTYIRLKGKNLRQIILHAEKIRKKSKFGMLCAPRLLRNGRDFRRIGDCVHDNEHWNENLDKWIDKIINDDFAKELLIQGKIEKNE